MPSKAFWLDLLQHTVRMFALAMVSSITVSAAGTASGYLPVTQVDWLGGFLIGCTAAAFQILLGLASVKIPGADPDTVSFLPKPPPTPPTLPKTTLP